MPTNKSLKGATGPQGPAGTNGTAGTPGTNGSSMLTGNGTPSNSTGNNGDSYLNLDDGKIYKKTGGSWAFANQILRGPKGDRGPSGYHGSDGATGSMGPPVPGFSAVIDLNPSCNRVPDGVWLLPMGYVFCGTGNHKMWFVGAMYNVNDETAPAYRITCPIPENSFNITLVPNIRMWYEGNTKECVVRTPIGLPSGDYTYYAPLNEPLRIR